jgi:PAS domain S-box-containing protein
VDVNAAACESHGYSREELLQLTIADLQEGLDAVGLERLWDTMLPGQPVTVETRSRRKDGSYFPVEVRVGRVDSEGEELMLASVRDVTARKEAEAELTRRAERQAAVADLGRRALAKVDTTALMDDAVGVVRAALGVAYSGVLELRPDHTSLLLRAGEGWPEALVGQGVVPIVDTHGGRTLQSDKPVIVADVQADERFRASTLLREHGVVSGITAVIQGRTGPFGVLGVHTTSPREFTSDDVNFLQAVANVLGAAVTREREEALQAHFERSRRVEAVGQLAGRIAHDFNNILAVVLNYTQFALEQAARQPRLRADLEEIDTAAQRAADLTRELLTFSRREPLETEDIDLNEIIRAGESMLGRTLGNRITLRSDLSDELWRTAAGEGQIDQILVQLALNARDAMPDGGVLAISTENLDFDETSRAGEPDLAPGHFVRLTVADTGIGMSEEVAAHAFDLFFSSKPTGRGSGLGLSTVHSVVRQLGGFVRLYSEPGVGTALKVYLPAATVDGIAIPPDLSPDDGDGETILLVEDEDAVRRLTSRILSEHGYDVIPADGIDAALAVWQERGAQIDLLLTDVVMPGMSGAALAERLRGERSKLPVLFMSGYTSGVVAREGPPEGVAVVEKPFSSQGLLRSVRQVLGRRM